jgi:hypothetical protein
VTGARGTSRPDALYLFVHLMKTAGSSLNHTVFGTFGTDAVWPHFDTGPSDAASITRYSSLDAVRSLDPGEHPGIRLVHGHLPYVARELLEVPAVVLTVLRDPVERALSHIRQHQAQDPTRSLEEVHADEGLRSRFFVDHQTKMLGMSTAEATDDLSDTALGPLGRPTTVGPEHLARAQRALDEIELLGVTEQLDQLLHQLEIEHGWSVRGVPVTNVGRATDVPASLRRAVAGDNQLDAALYERAVEILRVRRRQRTRRWWALGLTRRSSAGPRTPTSRRR